MALLKMLSDAGLEKFLPLFDEENITEDLLMSSSMDDIKDILKEIFPKTGDRLKVLNWVNRLKESVPTTLDMSLDSTATTIIIDNDGKIEQNSIELEELPRSNGFYSKDSISNPLEVSVQFLDQTGRYDESIKVKQCQTSQDMYDESKDSNLQMLDPEKLPYDLMPIETQIQHEQQKIQSAEQVLSQDTIDKLPTEENIGGKRNVSGNSDFSNSFGNFASLSKFLSSSKLGRALIANYDKNNRLADTDRQKLVHLIIDYVIDISEVVRNCDFLSIAQKISEIFPTEVSTIYYLPPKPKKNSSGKLVDRFRNQAKYIRKATAESISKKAKSNPPKKLEISFSQEMTEKISWLKVSNEPWSTVLAFWKDTFAVRSQERLEPGPVYDFLKKWPVVKAELGYNLIESDFNEIYPGLGGNLLCKWESVKQSLIQLVTEKKKVDLNNLKQEDEFSTINLLRQLPTLAPPCVFKTPTKTSWKPSISEAQDCFIELVSSPNELAQSIRERRDRYQKLGLTCQPVILADICASRYYVVFDDVQYSFSTILKAVDVAFKTHQVLNLQYNFEVTNTWTFVQKVLYNIHTIHDKPSPSTSVLIQSFKSIGQK